MRVLSHVASALMVACACASNASADVIVDTFGPSGSYDLGSDRVIASAGDGTQAVVSWRTGLKFIVGPDDMRLTSITLPIGTTSPGLSSVIRVRIAEDSNGLPGETVEVLSENEDVWPAMPVATPTVLESVAHSKLNAGGAYWVVVEPTTLALGTRGYLIHRSGVPGTAVEYRFQIDQMGLPMDPWSQIGGVGDEDVAFRVEGIIDPCPGLDVIYDNLDPGDGYSTIDATAASTSSPFDAQSRRLAARFEVGDVDRTLESVTLPIVEQNISSGGGLRISIAEDSAGLPGTVIEVLSENESIWPGLAPVLTTVASTTNPTLAMGSTYWILAEPTSSSAVTVYNWYHNSGGVPVTTIQQVSLGGVPTDPWTGTIQPLPLGFRVNGPQTLACTGADHNNDGVVDILDLLQFLSFFYGGIP